MQIYEFLKVKKVKCINVGGMCLTKDKEYQLLGVTDRSCMINDDNGYETWASMQRFEPVPNNDVSKDAKGNNTFKVGDKVYKFGDADVKIVLEVFKDGYMNLSNYPHSVNHESICHATQENYDALCKLYPNIKFEILDNSKFKIGDKVYCPSMLDGYIYVVKDNQATLLPLFVSNDHEDCYSFNTDGINEHNNPIVYHATEENRKALQVLHPDIEFETPPKEL